MKLIWTKTSHNGVQVLVLEVLLLVQLYSEVLLWVKEKLEFK